MTPKYWARIVAGMLIVFVVGTVVWRGMIRGKEFVSSVLPGSLPLLAAGFHVDGDRIGDIQRLQFMRSQPGRVDSAVITVKLDRVADEGRAGCALRVVRGRPFGSRTRFQCTSSADSARLELVPFGHVEFVPDGKRVTLYVARDAEDDLQTNAYHGAGGHDSGTVDIRAANDSFSVTVNGREIIHVSGSDRGGGNVVVRGANGKPIIEIGGDSNGGSVRITDANGNTRVNIHGKSDSRPDSSTSH
jgi:hypothetical protein